MTPRLARSAGLIGLATLASRLLGLVRDGRISASRLVEALSTSAAKLIPDVEAGRLRVGGRADITVIDPTRRWTVSKEALRSRSHNTPLLGKELEGAVALTLVSGRVIHQREA